MTTPAASHTPGPWSVQDNAWHTSSIVVPETTIARCVVPDDEIDQEASDDEGADTAKIRANARLIAAAPELLEALESCLPACTGPFVWLVPLVEKAIAKATGQTPA